MPKYSDEKRMEHQGLIRQAMAVRPNASLAEIIQMIYQVRGYTLDKNYVMKLRHKVYEERKRRFNTAQVNSRIAVMEDKILSVQTAMFEILLNPKAQLPSKTRAGSVIAMTEKVLFEAQIEAGIFEKDSAPVEVEDGAGPDQPILNAMLNMGLITDEEVIIDSTPKQIDGPKAIIKKRSKATAGGTKNKVQEKLR